MAVGAAFLAFGCAVVANAMVMQPSRHPAPLFAPPARAALREAPPLPPERPVMQASARSAEADTGTEQGTSERAIAARAAARTLETGTIGGMPPRTLDRPVPADKGLVLMQQALIKAGYGPAKADGMLGRETRASIERFERERRWPVTGEPSPKLLRELGLARQPRS